MSYPIVIILLIFKNGLAQNSKSFNLPKEPSEETIEEKFLNTALFLLKNEK